MRKTVRFLLLVMMAILMLPIVSFAEAGANLLENGDFEVLDGDGLPRGWYTDAYRTMEGVTLYSVTQDAHSGQNAAVVENLGLNDARFAQTVSVEPESMYRLSGYIRADQIPDSGRGANLSIADVFVFSESIFDSENGWIYVEMYGETGENQREVTVYARVGGYSGESIGKAAFDDLALVKVDTIPGSAVADLWFKQESKGHIAAGAEDPAETGIPAAAWPLLVALALLYTGASVWLMRWFQLDRREAALREAAEMNGRYRPGMPPFVMVGMLLAFLVRIAVALNVEGYQVDVNCFSAWGNTMAAVGPADFYQSNWCDYTPGYIYVMGFNGILANALFPYVTTAFVHKLIPMCCDLIGAWLIYRVATERRWTRKQAGLMALLFALNPAVIINSAAWCQIDSVLCVGLMLVAYLAMHRKWSLVLPVYVLCALVKPQALMLGFLGLTAIVQAVIRPRPDEEPCQLLVAIRQKDQKQIRHLLKDAGISLAIAAAVIAVLYLIMYLLSLVIKALHLQVLISAALILAVIVLAFLRLKKMKITPVMKELGIGLLTSAVVALVICLPFSFNQESPLWLFELYAETLSSYPYATVNTANLYYLFGANWDPIANSADAAACAFFAVISLGWGLYCFVQRNRTETRLSRLTADFAEPALMLCFGIAFIVMAVAGVSWTVLGVAAMAMAFAVVLPIYIRAGKLECLPLCGAVLFVLLYVLGIKMHERYLFPALFLFAMAYAIRRDRRILGLMVVLSCVLFINEGIVLDNSVRLGSAQGHLNNDTHTLAQLLSAVNVGCALLSAWVCRSICLGKERVALSENIGEPVIPAKEYGEAPCTPLNFRAPGPVRFTGKDALLMLTVTAVYAVVTLTTLGSAKAPQQPWKSTTYEEYAVIDLGEHYEDFSMLYNCQVSYNDFQVATGEDGETWLDTYWAQMSEGQCFRWMYLNPSYDNGETVNYVSANSFSGVQKMSGRFVKIIPQQIGLTINEVIFKDAEGNIIPAMVVGAVGGNENSPLFSDPEHLLDEQDTLEGEPGWWNSTYFDEIYHARTAFEHLNGTQPYETSHPPLGKVIMSWFVGLFGMTPFGWRFAGALCGILMLPAMYLLAKQLTRRTDMAFAAMMMMTLDCMHFTQTRIATIDSFPVLFIMLSYFFMLRFMQRDIVLDDVKSLLPDLALSGFFMGCGFASKWIGAYAGLGLAVLFFWTCLRHLRIGMDSARMLRTSSRTLNEEERALLIRRDRPAMQRVITLCLWCLLFFVAIPLVIYILSYVPYYAYRKFTSPLDFLTAIWKSQEGMLGYHSTPGLGMDHPFYSPWYEWPLMQCPMYYASPSFVPAGWSYAIFCFGNPAVWFAGLAGIGYVAYLWASRHRYTVKGGEGTLQVYGSSWSVVPAFVLIGLLAQFLPWVLVPRGTYIYHYFASVPFLILGTTLLLDRLRRLFPKAGRWIVAVYLGLCLVCFIVLFPYASGVLTPTGWLDFVKGLPFLRVWY